MVTNGAILISEREVMKMKKKDFIETIKHQFGIVLEVERSARNWIYVRIGIEEQYKVLPYLEKNKIIYEKHLNNGYYIVF